jgi:hypothetical protein
MSYIQNGKHWAIVHFVSPNYDGFQNEEQHVKFILGENCKPAYFGHNVIRAFTGWKVRWEDLPYFLKKKKVKQ